MPSLRICLATDCYQPSIGGIENHVFCLASELGRMGHHVDVLTHRALVPANVRHHSAASAPPPPENVTLRRLDGLVLRARGSDPMADPRTFATMRRTLETNGYEVVHGHSFASLIVLAALREGKRLGIPTVLTKHSMTLRPTRSAFINRLALRVEALISGRWADATITLSDASRLELEGTGIGAHLIHGGVDCNHWRPSRQARERARASLGYGNDDVVIGYLGRLVQSKGVAGLIGVAARLRSLPNVRFLLVGDGPMRPELERRIEALGLGQAVRLVGFVPWFDTPDYLNAMDVFAFPSYTEACGLALLEAMACGLPVVARDNAGSREVLAEQDGGSLIETDDELHDRLRQLVEDEDLRRRLGLRARERVQAGYSWQVVAEATATLYGSVLSGEAAVAGRSREEAAGAPVEERRRAPSSL